jgi:hypothetical protein
MGDGILQLKNIYRFLFVSTLSLLRLKLQSAPISRLSYRLSFSSNPQSTKRVSIHCRRQNTQPVPAQAGKNFLEKDSRKERSNADQWHGYIPSTCPLRDDARNHHLISPRHNQTRPISRHFPEETKIKHSRLPLNSSQTTILKFQTRSIPNKL